ncbi:G-protein coupled receptor Mth2-like [Contarinia nasturtii]|uniref:G-protein coupled receptor Mth2-like n=1 Tax=Contarinia nasturtii TaxID=265458 RepID=UPI0012D3CC98|nr:G-protein coupled receptor Mth2-like [Contarinia nasturtii]
MTLDISKIGTNLVKVFITILINVNWCCSQLIRPELPCDFSDSVNITDGLLHQNKSITFNGIEFPRDHYANISYVLENEVELKVIPYFRGCPCIDKSCIRLCCPLGTFVEKVNPNDGSMICSKNETVKNLTAEVFDQNNQSTILNLDQHFGYVDRICKLHHFVDNFKITHTGNILYGNQLYSHHEYCLHTISKNANEVTLVAGICMGKPDPLHPRFSILPYTMMTSVVFLIITIFLHVYVLELRNLFSKSFICYLISLIMFFVVFALVQWNGANYVEPYIRKISATIIYFSFLSTFLWLNVISFDIWMNFCQYRGKILEKNQHRLNMLYAWGLALFFTIICHVCDAIESIPFELKPGMGFNTGFLKEEPISKFIYYYFPLCIIITVNIVFFGLTAMEIRQSNQMMVNVNNDSIHFNRKRDSFIMYLRLFIVMGVLLGMEAATVIDPDHLFFLVMDICNTLQGVIIFVLFVLKKSVLRSIKTKLAGNLKNQKNHQSNLTMESRSM